jgi:hypothetical protein
MQVLLNGSITLNPDPDPRDTSVGLQQGSCLGHKKILAKRYFKLWGKELVLQGIETTVHCTHINLCIICTGRPAPYGRLASSWDGWTSRRSLGRPRECFFEEVLR